VICPVCKNLPSLVIMSRTTTSTGSMSIDSGTDAAEIVRASLRYHSGVIANQTQQIPALSAAAIVLSIEAPGATEND